MSSIVRFTLLILCVISFVKSIPPDESSEGRCLKISGAPNFSLNTLQGHWYCIKEREFVNGRCLESFAESPVGRNLSFYSLFRDETGAQVRLNVTLISHLNDPARVDVYRINNDEAQFWGIWVYFYVDYDSCFGAATCKEKPESGGKYRHNVKTVICCRNSQPSDEDLQPVFDEMKKQGLHKYKMKNYEQKNCTH